MKSKIKQDGSFDGNYTDLWLTQNQDKTIKGDLVSDWVFSSTLYDGSLNDAIWNGSEWIEQASQEEIVAKRKKIYKEKIETAFSHLYIRALASSMNKSRLDLNFLTAQREVYQDKYDVAKGIITSGVKYDNTLELIQGEMDDEFSEDVLNATLTAFGLTPNGTHLDKMYQLIIFKFEYGLNAFSNFKKFIERFRTKSFTWLDAGLCDKIDQGIDLVNGLPDALTLQEAETLYNQFNAI